MTEYKIWRPEHDGHAPPYWRDGMSRNFFSISREAWLAVSSYDKSWSKQHKYQVPPEALTAPNEDAVAAYNSALIEKAVKSLRQYPAEELAKHGITLSEPKDWATELWADLFAVRGMPSAAKSTREGRLEDEDRAAIALIRERVVLKERV